MRRAIIALCIVGVVFASLPLLSQAAEIIGIEYFADITLSDLPTGYKNSNWQFITGGVSCTVIKNGSETKGLLRRIDCTVHGGTDAFVQLTFVGYGFNIEVFRSASQNDSGYCILDDGYTWATSMIGRAGTEEAQQWADSCITYTYEYQAPIIPNPGTLYPGPLKLKYYEINPQFSIYQTTEHYTPVSYTPTEYDNDHCIYNMSFDIPVLYEIDGKKYIYNGSTSGIYLSIAGADPPINNNNANATTAARTLNGEPMYHITFSATAGGSTDVSRVDWNFLAEIAWEAYDQTGVSIPLDNFTLVVTYKEATIDDIIGAINDLISREQQGNGKLDIISGKLDDLGDIYNAVEDNTDVLQDILSALDDLELNLELDQVQSSGLFALINTAQDIDEKILAARGKLPRQLTENEENNVNNAMNNASTNLGSLLQEAAADVSPLRYLIQRTFGLPIIGSVLFILIIFGLTLWLLKRGED